MQRQKENILKKLGKGSITVSDIASQFWCEKQMELNYLYGKRYTAAMSDGSKIHTELEEEVKVALAAEPITYADFLYKTGYESYFSLKDLIEKRIGREVRIYGSVNGYKLTGQIDELRIKNGMVTIIENKTKESGKQISDAATVPHRVQVMLYRKMLDEIKSKAYTYENFAYSYRLGSSKLSEQFMKQLAVLGIDGELGSLEKVYKVFFNEITRLPEISDKLELHYIDRFTGSNIASITVNYDKEAIAGTLVKAMSYWNGERDAAPVPKEEKWKCNFCRFFGRECTVYS